MHEANPLGRNHTFLRSRRCKKLTLLVEIINLVDLVDARKNDTKHQQLRGVGVRIDYTLPLSDVRTRPSNLK